MSKVAVGSLDITLPLQCSLISPTCLFLLPSLLQLDRLGSRMIVPSARLQPRATASRSVAASYSILSSPSRIQGAAPSRFPPSTAISAQSTQRHLQSTTRSRPFTTTTTMATSTRTESDAFGEIQVPSNKYWGAQTERSLENFKINQPQDRMPPPIVRAFGILKGAAAAVNMTFGLGRPFCNLQLVDPQA